MKRLDSLPEIAARQLGGLEANETLLAKIRMEAADQRAPRRAAVLRPVLAVCTALVLAVGAAAVLHGGTVVDAGGEPKVMDSHSAGQQAAPTEVPSVSADVPAGSITMSAGGQRRARTLFAAGSGASFPLVTLNGATYRLLDSPSGISASLLGEELGVVTEFTIEPALGSSGAVSNVVACGDAVHAVGDMGGALVAATVDGSLRVFQRVSYAGTGIVGSERLADTLCTAQDVAWIEVDGLGRVEDQAQAQALMQILLDGADYQGTGQSGTASMQIGLTNGLTLQLFTGEDCVSACGTWSCPDFFEAFAQAAS